MTTTLEPTSKASPTPGPARDTHALPGTPLPGRAVDPAVKVSRLGYITYDTPNLDAMVHHYRDVLGFAVVEESPSQVFLTTGVDHHCLVLNKAEVAAGRTNVGYEVGMSLADADRRLSAVGLTGQRRSDIAPGTPDVLVLTEPQTGIEMHLYEDQTPSGAAQTWDQRPTKLGHVAAYTPNTDDMRSFYQEALGFRWSDTIGDFFVFLRCNADHHAANFMQSTNYSGMHHIAFEFRDFAHLQISLDTLDQHGLSQYWGPGRHVPGHNIFAYHEDPDGHHVELFTQLDVMIDEEKGYYEPRPWHEHFPMYPQSWEVDYATRNKWGPMPAMTLKR